MDTLDWQHVFHANFQHLTLVSHNAERVTSITHQNSSRTANRMLTTLASRLSNGNYATH